MAWVAAGEDRRVVGKGHGRERCQRPVPTGRSLADQARHIRGLAPTGKVVEHVGVGPVPENPDQIPGAARALEQGIHHQPVLVGEQRPVRFVIAREQPQHRRRHIDESAANVGHPEPWHPGARRR